MLSIQSCLSAIYYSGHHFHGALFSSLLLPIYFFADLLFTADLLPTADQ